MPLQTKRTEELLWEVLEATPGALMITDATGTLIFANSQARELFGHCSRDLIGRDFALLVPDSPQTLFSKPDGASVETTALRSDYSKFPAVVTSRSIDLGEGQFVSVQVRDISEQKRAEQALHQGKMKQLEILHGLEDGYFELDLDENVTFRNDALTRMLGYAPGERLGPDYKEHVTSETSGELSRRLREIRENGKPAPASPYQIVRSNGSVRSIEASISPIKDTVGRTTGFRGIVRDISERMKAEENLRKSHQEKEFLLRSIPAILIAVDSSDKIIQWNKAAEKTFELSASEMLGRAFCESGIDWDWGTILPTLSDMHPVRLDEMLYKSVSGREGYLGITITPIEPDDSRENSGFLIIGADITERKNLETQLAQAQKLESIGQLAAGIAHEVNTPTQYVSDNVQFLKDAFADLQKVLQCYQDVFENSVDRPLAAESRKQLEEAAHEADVEYLYQEVPKAISQSLDGLDRVARIVRAMKEFSHPGTGEKTPTDIHRAIESTLTVCRNEWKYVAELVTDFDRVIPSVPCFPGDLNQAILNLVINAAHAIAATEQHRGGTKGTITVKTRKSDIWAEIEISDTGTGIPEAVRPRIFDPFFTTKEIGKGTGQGLAIAHASIVQKHGGSITFKTELGRGTAFVIRLPLETGSENQDGIGR